MMVVRLRDFMLPFGVVILGMCNSSYATLVEEACYGEGPQYDVIRSVGGTAITLSAAEQTPIDSQSSVHLTVNNAQVSITYQTYHGAYTDSCLMCDDVTGACQMAYPYRAPKWDLVQTRLEYPSGTALITQDGELIGSASLGTSASYTTPPVNKAGTLSFVATFTPDPGTLYIPATSNAVTIESKSTRAPAILVPIIIDLILGE